MQYNGMMFRHELKYYISYPEYYKLISRLNVAMEHDLGSGVSEKGYFIRSLYFDDMYQSSYMQKEAGDYERSKYRIRIYNLSQNTNDIKLEKKTKVDQYISKRSANISKEQFYNILSGDGSFLLNMDRPVARDFYIAMRTRLLQPAVIVDYYRDAYICREGNVRITFDKELRAAVDTFDIFDPDAITVDAMERDRLVMEVKYDDFLPRKIRTLIQPAASEHMAISKYVLCRNAKNLTQRKEVNL